MEFKIIKHGNHIINDDTDGYMYNFNASKSYDFNSHIHHCFEFIRIIKGRLIYIVENSEYMLSDGDLIMTKPEEFHSFSFPQECEYQREFLHIYPGFLKDYPQITKKLNERKEGYFNRISAKVVQKYGIDKIFSGIEEYCKAPVEETDFMVLTYTLQLIVKINRIIRSEAPEKQEVITHKKANIVCRYIDTHYMENITLDTIAALTYMSPTHASRIFKKETGMNIKSYLTMRRITHAKSLIMEGRKIMSILFDCGFKDYSTFYRAFVKYVGVSPDEFKKSQNKNNLAKQGQ